MWLLLRGRSAQSCVYDESYIGSHSSGTHLLCKTYSCLWSQRRTDDGAATSMDVRPSKRGPLFCRPDNVEHCRNWRKDLCSAIYLRLNARMSKAATSEYGTPRNMYSTAYQTHCSALLWLVTIIPTIIPFIRLLGWGRDPRRDIYFLDCTAARCWSIVKSTMYIFYPMLRFAILLESFCL